MRQEMSNRKIERPGNWSMACLLDATKVIRFMGFQAGIQTISWDGRDDRESKLPEGTYVIQIGAGTLEATGDIGKIGIGTAPAVRSPRKKEGTSQGFPPSLFSCRKATSDRMGVFQELSYYCPNLVYVMRGHRVVGVLNEDSTRMYSCYVIPILFLYRAEVAPRTHSMSDP